MARVVEAVAPQYGDSIHYEKIITTKFEGATRYVELTRKLGKLPPVPSIFVDGELVFERTPGPEKLQAFIEKYMAEIDGKS
jgi:hypothetical protein